MTRFRALACAFLSGVLLACSGGGVSDDAGPNSGTQPADDGGAPAVESIEIAVEDFVFDARIAGPDDGAVVFLLHGFPQTSYQWMPQIAALAEAGYRVVAPDQRGYSSRARPANVEEYDALLLAGDVLGMADALGVESFHVVGHDWGAAVAWIVAGVAADRVTSLAALSVPHPDAFAAELADTTSCQYAASAYFDLFSAPGAETTLLADDAAVFRGVLMGVPPDSIDEYVRVLGTEEALGAALNWYRANVGNRMLTAPELGPIAAPTLFIWSDADIAICRETAERCADHVTGPWQFEILPGVSHWITEEAPGVTANLLLEHLGEDGE